MEKNVVATDVNQFEMKSLSGILGQRQVRDKLIVIVSAHRNGGSGSNKANSPVGPFLFTGPSGVGKTMTAKALSEALGNRHLIETNGVAMNSRSELCSILLDLDNGWTLFVDEAHGLNPRTQLILLTVLSEKTLRVPAGNSRYHSIPLADFTAILVTTDEYLLSEPLRNRMRVKCRFKDYSVEDLVQIIRQRVEGLNWRYESDEVLRIVAQRAKGNPRQALNRNLQMCWDVAKSHNRDLITLGDVDEAFYHLQVDELGLDQSDRAYLAILCECGQAPLGELSAKLSMPALTIQRIVEPYLLKEGFVTKGKSSVRVITQKGRWHVQNTKMALS